MITTTVVNGITFKTENGSGFVNQRKFYSDYGMFLLIYLNQKLKSLPNEGHLYNVLGMELMDNDHGGMVEECPSSAYLTVCAMIPETGVVVTVAFDIEDLEDFSELDKHVEKLDAKIIALRDF